MAREAGPKLSTGRALRLAAPGSLHRPTGTAEHNLGAAFYPRRHYSPILHTFYPAAS